jgi:arabinogalactan endo-1,4-beta-galactosidase
MKQAEDRGFAFKENGQAKHCLQIFRDHGYNWIRLRLFHTPDRLPNSLEYTIALAKEAKQQGFRFLLDLREYLFFMANEYRKDLIVVEAAYNWKSAEYIDRNAPFAESPEGQKEFLEEVNRMVMGTPDNRGVGLFWWEPAVTRGYRGFFDEEGNVLPVITVFDRFTRK